MPNINSFKKIIQIFTFTGCVIFIFLFSEILFQTKNPDPEIAFLFFKHIPLINTNRIFSNKLNIIVEKSLYKYLAFVAEHTSDHRNCKPLCLEFDKEQYYLMLFKHLDQEDGFKLSLNNNQRSELYTWMATLNIWHDEDVKTLALLENAELLDVNFKYQPFLDDMQKLVNIPKDYKIEIYFMENLNNIQSKDVDKIIKYKRIYLSKASHFISIDFLEQGKSEEALFYAKKALELNPWKLDNYRQVYLVYNQSNNSLGASNVLETCTFLFPNNTNECSE